MHIKYLARSHIRLAELMTPCSSAACNASNRLDWHCLKPRSLALVLKAEVATAYVTTELPSAKTHTTTPIVIF